MKQHHANFIIETSSSGNKKKLITSRSNQRFEAFFKATNFILPTLISFSNGEKEKSIYFDKVVSSNNFYCALEEPILPQISGNYQVNWNFRCQSEKEMILKAIIRTSLEEKQFDFVVHDKLTLNVFETIIPCQGFAAGDGIIFEIQMISCEDYTFELVTSKIEIEYDAILI